MLYGLAKHGNAPRFLASANKRGVPVPALLASAAATGLCVVTNYFIPGKAFELFMGLVVSALLINWAMISLIHLRFRASKRRNGLKTGFQSVGYPLTNYLCLAFLALNIVVMCYTPDLAISVVLIPIWLGLLSAGYFLKMRRKSQAGQISGDLV
jgi:L-asparagine transporter-like permease